MRAIPSLAALLVLAAIVGCKGHPARDPNGGLGTGSVHRDSTTKATDSAVNPSPVPTAVDNPPADSLKAKPTATVTPAPTPKPPHPAVTTPGATAGVTSTTAATSPGAAANSGTELRDAYHTAPLDTVDGKTYQGWKYFNLNCARCHGEDVSGTTIAPHLIVSLKPNGPIPDEATFTTTVCDGRVDRGMPAWCSTGMTREQIDTIYAYVKGRSEAKLHPGRPARKT